MIGQDNASPQSQILSIQKSPRRTLRHLKTLSRFSGIAIFSAVFYLLYWKDSSIRQQYETIFWWLTLICGIAVMWWSESSQPSISTNQKSPRRTLSLKTLFKVAATVIFSAIFELIFLKNNPMAGQYEVYVRWLTLIFGAAAVWLLVRDWITTGGMTITFDGNKEHFRIVKDNHTFIQLSFQAIKRIKIEESSNLYPVYILSLHLQDGEVLEIDASADQGEINRLAGQISEMTGAQIVMQHYDEPRSKEEKEDQRMYWNQTYKGD